MSTNLVSIIIPCYNQGAYLNETLFSVFEQTYTNWQCLIIDDGSTDNSAEIAKIWTNKDNRFQYFYKENSGVSDARNLGLQNANGEFIQFLDADDYLCKEKLSKSLYEINSRNADVVCTNYQMFYTLDKPFLEAFSDLKTYNFDFESVIRYWNSGFTIPPHCLLIRKSFLDGIEFSTKLTAQEDWVVWVQLFQKKPKVFYLDENLVLYRINATSRTNSGEIINETLAAVRYLKNKLSDADFELLYEAVIEKYNARLTFLQVRHRNLKASNTYLGGLMVKKVLSKLHLLLISKKVLSFFVKFKK